LCIYVRSEDSYGHGVRNVVHIHPVPVATFNRQAWSRWIFDRVL